MATEQERKIAKSLHKASKEYGKLNAKQRKQAIKDIDETRLALIDDLEDAAKKDNTISKSRANSMIRSLEDIEDEIHKRGTSTLKDVQRESAKAGVSAGAGALEAGVGHADIGVKFDTINRNVLEYISKRFSDDELQLSERVWQMAGDTRDELSRVLRTSIIKGDSVSAMSKKVRQVYDNEAWKIDRLVRTEGNTAYRTATSHIAQRSDVVKALRLHDGAAHNPEHRCYQLSHDDPHGLGEGVYYAYETKIYSPHPNCTSYVTYVIDEGGA